MTNHKLELPNVTLVALTSVKIEATIKAMKYSMRKIIFGECIFISHEKPITLPDNIKYAHIAELKDINDFNYSMIYKMGQYINTDYILLVHYDGFVVNPKRWRDEFLNYDYIGSPWPYPKNKIAYRDKQGNVCRVGNSVSIRSKRLLEFPMKASIPWELENENDEYNEDTFLCCKHKNMLENHGMRFAPIEIAKYFGHEREMPETAGIQPFVFHKWGGDNWRYPMFHLSFRNRVKFKIKSILARIKI